jgi:nucleotide-binding universal stress UspA family protein
MRVLFATDGRPPALAAEELLRRLADPTRVEVTILSALEDVIEPSGRSSVADVLDAADERFRRTGIASTTIEATGDPTVAVERELLDEGFGLTVVGAGDRSWLGRLAFGSVSFHLLHVAPTPLLVVHRAPFREHDRLRVLVGADGSPAAMRAIDTLTSLTTPDLVELSVRSVVRLPDVGFAAYPGASVPAAYLEEATGAARHAAEEGRERSIERLRARGFAARGSLGSGWPGIDLLARADRDDVDLLVAGARGLGRIERLAMGSVSGHLARHAPATLVARAARVTVEHDPLDAPNGHVARSRYAVRWG